MDGCVFCKVAQGEVPSKLVFQDDVVMVVLDVHPASKGHMLVIPKEHYQDMSVTPETVLERMIVVSKQMGALSSNRLGSTGYNVLTACGRDAQQSVFHLHYHVVPRYKDDGLDLWFHGESDVPNMEAVYTALTKNL